MNYIIRSKAFIVKKNAKINSVKTEANGKFTLSSRIQDDKNIKIEIPGKSSGGGRPGSGKPPSFSP